MKTTTPPPARRDEIPHGYRTFTGVIPSNNEIDRYNMIQRDINAWIDAGREVPDELLNRSHYFFAMMAEEV